MTNIMNIFLVHFGATCFMTGVIWFVQLIHYPFLNEIPEDKFIDYHRRYSTKIGYIAAVGMGIELLSGTLISALFIDHNIPLIHLNMALLFVIWISTFAIQVPCHSTLSKGYDAAAHRRLIKTNWIRTVAWTARVVVLATYLVI